MNASADVLIVGGGVIGCSIAYHLSKHGIKVTLLERGAIGGQASGAAAGLFSLLKPQSKINPLSDYNRLLFASLALFPSLVAELEAASGIDLEYEQTGTLRTIGHAIRVPRLQPWLRSCREAGLAVELLDEEVTHHLEPLLAPDICAAISFPSEGQVRATRVVTALTQAAINNGAIFHSHTEVVALQQQASRVTAVTTAQGETIPCGHLVLAPGAWAAQCGQWLDLTLPVSPQRGQVLSLRQPDPPIRHILIGKGIYLAPKQDGTVVVGATKDDVGFDARLTAGGIRWLLDSAIQLVPALEQCAIERLWAGLRPKTPDNYPILGTTPNWHNVTLATGHYSFGILLSAITGHTLSELITTGVTPTIIQPFALDRFTNQSQ